MFTGHELEMVENETGRDHHEESRTTEMDRNKRIKQQLKVYLFIR